MGVMDTEADMDGPMEDSLLSVPQEFWVNYFCIVIIFLAPRVTGVDVDGDGIADFNVVNRAPLTTTTTLARSGVWGGWPRVTGVDVDGDGIADYNVVNRNPWLGTTGLYRSGVWGGYPRVTGVDVDGDGIADFNVVGSRARYAGWPYRSSLYGSYGSYGWPYGYGNYGWGW